MQTNVKYFATHKFSYVRSDGTVVEWQQEEETAVTSREEAVAMIQRTIDFWVPYLASEITRRRNVSLDQAWTMARVATATSLEEMMGQGLAKQWALNLDDFTLPTMLVS